MADANSDNNEILHDFSPMLRAYKDGRVERFTGLEFVPPSVDPETRVQSKDVQISPENGVSARMYLPGNPNPTKKLPLLVYFHGGGFAVESSFSPLYHRHLNFLVGKANAVAVSVNYRLAPEHPLPAAYDDSWEAIKWVSHSGVDEKWLEQYADLNCVYLGGDSAGANIAHNIAVRVGSEKVDGISLCGIFLNCPFFGGEDSVGVEGLNEFTDWKSFGDKLWPFVCPTMSGRDEPWINPATDSMISRLGCRRVLVYVAEKDMLKARGWYYKEILEKSGWDGDVEVVEVQGENHVFSVFSPDGENGLAMLKKVGTFINDQY